MKTLRLLRVVFDTPLASRDLAAFRAAIAEKVGFEHDLFHNHRSDEEGGGFHYRYPLIQYQSTHQQASIICLGDGVEAIHHLFSQDDWQISVLGKPCKLSIDRLHLHEFKMQVWQEPFQYQIRNWIGLNQKNFRIYQQTTSLVDRLQILEKILTSHIVMFSIGIGWKIDQQIKVEITEVPKTYTLQFKNIPLMGFYIQFQTNVFLPNFIGLGKGVSKGFGVVKRRRKRVLVESE